MRIYPETMLLSSSQKFKCLYYHNLNSKTENVFPGTGHIRDQGGHCIYLANNLSKQTIDGGVPNRSSDLIHIQVYKSVRISDGNVPCH